MPHELELVTNDELIHELGRRFSGYVFSGIINRTKREAFTERHYSGDLHICLGLVARVQHDILMDIDDGCEELLE